MAKGAWRNPFRYPGPYWTAHTRAGWPTMRPHFDWRYLLREPWQVFYWARHGA